MPHTDQKRIAQLEETIAKLKRELVTDELTKLYNRRGINELIKPLINEVQFQLQNPDRRRNVIIRSLSVVLVDIDHFKKVNDTYGHQTGDEALKTVAGVLRKNVRGLDVVGRWGGEEMLIILVGANKIDAEGIAENLRQKIEQNKVIHDGKTVTITASFGVAELTETLTADELFKKADEALYLAKENGRNRVVVAS